MDRLPSEKVQRNLLTVLDHFEQEDRAVRERQIRKARRLKLYWDYIFQAYWSEVAHDWRIWDSSIVEDTADQAYYDKPVNTFRAYIETIIAALSVSTPTAKCYPEDADSTLDTITAKAGDKIGQLIARHNNDPLLWLKGLYTYYTEGTVFFYNYTRADDKYGTYEEKEYEEEEILKNGILCPNCGNFTEIDEVKDGFQPEEQPQDLCTECGTMISQVPQEKSFIVEKLVGSTKHPKSRVCVEAYGCLNVKIANYAKTPERSPYLIYAYETHYADAIEEFNHLLGNKKLKKKIADGGEGPDDTYSQWGRLNTVYQGEYPNFVVTRTAAWLRPSAFNVLNDEDDIKELRKLYPRGVQVVKINDEFGCAKSEALDDYWTILINPLEDYLVYDPAGTSLVNTQEITNDVISLVLQTLEHGIGQTFADPAVLNFKAYKETESIPGGVYEAIPKSGKTLNDSFYQVKTATLSGEVMPFFQLIQGLAQLVSGALPSLFGGELEGSDTASEYSMSRAQALQRVQNTWKMLTAAWKEVKGKSIPMYINSMKADEKDVVKLPSGSFQNVFIRLSELHGKIGKIELEAAENLPQTWGQIKETVMKMFELQTPQFLEMLQSPENIPVLRDTLGLTNFYIPGEDDRSKQNDEIQELLASAPIQNPNFGQPGPDGMPDQQEYIPSVEIDVTYDNHNIQFEIVRQWVTSEAGRLAKIDNEEGYQNVLLHGQQHFFEMNKQMILAQSAAEPKGKDNPEKPAGSSKISGEEDVNASV